MCQYGVLKLGSAQREVIVGLRQFLDIMKKGLNRIGINLNNSPL
mgnify:CR=1 FL=1